jgi:hypothetical protein
MDDANANGVGEDRGQITIWMEWDDDGRWREGGDVASAGHRAVRFGDARENTAVAVLEACLVVCACCVLRFAFSGWWLVVVVVVL